MNKITLDFFLAKSKTTIKGLLALFVFLLMNTQASWGQQLLQWNTLGNLGTETAEPSIFNDTNISASNLTLGSVTAAANGNRFGGSGWFNTGNTTVGNTLAEAVSGNDYIQFVVTPNSGFTFTPTSFVFKWDRSNTGPSNVTLRSSVDGYASDLGSVTGMVSGGAATTTDRTITITGLTNISSATTFRIYGYGATATTGTGGFDCTTGSTVNVSLNGTTAIVWSGSSWSNTIGPNSSINAIVDGTYNTNVGGIQGPFTANKLTVTSLGSLTINSGTNVTVQNDVINNGSLVVENNANLIQVNNVANTGSITVNRNGNALKRLDYTLWSSPVSGQSLTAFSSLTSQDPSRFYSFDTTFNTGGVNGAYAVIANPTLATANFSAGAGYLIRMPNTDPTSGYDEGAATLAYPGVFTGTPNNGNVPVTLGYLDAPRSYNLVGNPYPSVIDANTFIAENTSNIESTLYFWRKTNGSGTAYAAYNPAGGTSTYASTTSEVPNGKIQVGQGFIVQAKSAGLITNFFTNLMRDSSPTSTQFFRTKQVVQKDRVWLNLTNSSGVFSQALVGYFADGTQGLDIYDGKYINDSPIALTSNINNEEYTIQGRPTFDASDIVALNFKTDVAGDYTIGLDHVDGLFSGSQDIYLVDSKTGAETNLKTSSYTFAAVVGVDNARFSLKYQKTLKVDAPILNGDSITVYKNNGVLYVNSATKSIKTIKVFDIQGRLIAEQNNLKANTAEIHNLKATHQVLIVKVTSEDNQIISKKVDN